MSNIRKPKRLEQRPHWKGLPIPYITMIDNNGQPDFRVTDEAKRRTVISNRWCQLCGQPLGKRYFFVGGTEAAKGNCYFEPATHLDCLIYAMQVCPFIAGKLEHADIVEIQKEYQGEGKRVARHAGGTNITLHADDTFTSVKNPLWVIKKAVGYKLTRSKDGTYLLVPWPIVKETEPLHAQSMTADEWKKVMTWLSSDP